MMLEENGLELRWPNKDFALLLDGDDGYRWSDPGDAPDEPPTIRELGRFGDSEDGVDGYLLIGDSLEALRALGNDQEWVGDQGVRLVYIDPPFNTGQAFAQYGDSLAPGVWLSMLRDRLEAVKPLMASLASVWVHLDDGEQHRARCLLDEVFGEDAFVATVVWQKRTTRESRSAFSSSHDYIHVYAPAGPKRWKKSRNLIENDGRTLRNRDGDPRGPWADAPFTAPGYRANQQYDIVNPAGEVLRPPKGRSWFATEPVYQKLLNEGRIWFPRGGAGLPRIKMFPKHLRGLVPSSLWGPEEGGTNDEAKRHLMAMFPDEEAFATPKPEALLERVVHIASDPGDLVVDFFAGSGTTAAVSHKMGRRWIAVERSPSTVTTFAVPRLAKVVRGEDQGGVTQSVDWHGGGSFVVGSLVEAVPEPGVIEALIQQHNHTDPPVDRAAFAMGSRSLNRSKTPTLFDEGSTVDDEIDVA